MIEYYFGKRREMGKRRNLHERARSDELNVQLNLLAAEHGYDVLGGDNATLMNTQKVAGSALDHGRNLHEVASEKRRLVRPGPPVKIDIGLGNKVKKGGDSMIRRRSGLTTEHRLDAAKTRTMKIGPEAAGEREHGDGSRRKGTNSVGRSSQEGGNSKAAKKRKRKHRENEAAGRHSKAARSSGGGGDGGGAATAAKTIAPLPVPEAPAATVVEGNTEDAEGLKWTDEHQHFLDATRWTLPQGVQAGSRIAMATTLQFSLATSSPLRSATAASLATVMIRDAREAICKLRTPMWCLSCVTNAEQMMMQTGDPELNGEGVAKLRNVRRQITRKEGGARTGGKGTLAAEVLIKVLIDLDEVYFKCQYFTSTTRVGGGGGVEAIMPVSYFRSTGPALDLAAAAVAKFKASPEMQNGGDTLGLLKWSAKAGATTVPSTPSNPLLEALRLRFVETVVLFHHSGLAQDGRFKEALVSSRAGSNPGAMQHQHLDPKPKAGKKKKKKRAASDLDSKAAAVAAANEPVCDGLLASWRDSCRDWLARFYGFATPNKKALGAIKKVGPLVEVGAGTGYWSSLLRARGADIVSYDIAPAQLAAAAGASRSKSKKGSAKHKAMNEYHGNVPGFTDVRIGDSRCVAEHKDRALFLCYPPPAEPMAADTLKAYAGNCVVYAGEWRGLTADPLFEKLLEKSFRLESRLSLPNFGNQASQLTVWRRRSQDRSAAASSGSSSSTMLACNGWPVKTLPTANLLEDTNGAGACCSLLSVFADVRSSDDVIVFAVES